MKKKSKYVDSWFVFENKHGIISLMFNTTERWIHFHQYDDTTYDIGCNDDEGLDSEGCVQEIDVFLNPEIRYLKTVCQEKDQITFYFIPIEYLRGKSRKILTQGKNDYERLVYRR